MAKGPLTAALAAAALAAGALRRPRDKHQPNTSGPTRWLVALEVDKATNRRYWRATPYERPEYRALFTTHAEAMNYAQNKPEVP